METQDRREFVRSLALGASAAVVIAPGASRADDPKPKDKEPEKKTEPKPEEAARTEVDALGVADRLAPWQHRPASRPPSARSGSPVGSPGR